MKKANRSPVTRSRKLAGLITRVSLDEQARNPEGSLVNQLQRSRSHLQYKKDVAGEEWTEAGHYELRGISGKDSVRSQEFERLYDDVRAGKIDVVVVTALDRVSRSVKDFLIFFEFLTEHGVEFVSLREGFDTTSPQGKLQATILMALAEFERALTAQRTSEAMADRAERGLWNGGQLLGYDPDPERPGYLKLNKAESRLINHAHDTYLQLGSIKGTVDTVNRQGYRTKSFVSRRGKHHPGKEFGVSSMQYLLKNVAYIGKKEIKQKGESEEVCRLVDAVWPPIVSEEKFQLVQRLMADNGQTHRSGAPSVQHVYCLSGLVHCDRCGGKMDGESATGNIGKKYFYYRCSNRECRMRVAAQEIEDAIVDRFQLLAEDPELLDRLTAETNRKLQQGRPKLEHEIAGLEKDLKEVKAMADKLLTELSSMDQQPGQSFIKDKLNGLGLRQADIQHGIAEGKQELDGLDREAVDVDLVRSALGQVKELFGALKPYEQRELMKLVLRRAEVNEREITLEVYALSETKEIDKVGADGDLVRMPPKWLPE